MLVLGWLALFQATRIECDLPDGKPFVLTAPDGGRAKLASLGVAVSDLLS